MSSSDSKLGSVKQLFTLGMVMDSLGSKLDVAEDVLTPTNFLFNSAHLQESK
jgi:hypothetical protein